MDDPKGRRIEVFEPGAIPRLDIIFGFGPTIPFVLGAAAAVGFEEPWRQMALQITILWGSAILLFLAGVRRGLSFRTEGGPTWAQMATMLMLFGLGLCSLAVVSLDRLIWAFALLLIGFTAIFVLDPIAARRGEAPLYFEHLRRLQIPIILVALAVSAVISVRT
jgi:hypothetical protein